MRIKVMSFTKWEVFFAFSVLIIPFSAALTDTRDVSAINNLYMSLSAPSLPGWVAFGGDPCGDGWHGVVCDSSSITEIRIRGMNVGGSLSDSIADFSSIQVMDFSNNQIGGTIPQALPFTIQNFTLSGNQFIGTIPFTLSFLSGLSELSFGNNLLSGEVPDYFQQLTQLIRLDLSSNNLTGELPPSMKDLSSLTTLHLQNNKLTGTIDVLEDLPLNDLNVQNNLFSGPIPPKLLTIPNFKKDGTPFNTSVITPPPPGALPPLSSASPPLVWSPPSDEVGEPSRSGSGQPTFEVSPPSGSGKFWTSQRIILAVASVAIIVLVMGLFVTLWKCCKSEKHDLYDAETHNDLRPDFNESPKIEKVSREPVVKPFDGYGAGGGKNGFPMSPRGEKAQVAMPAELNMPRKPLPQPPIRFQSQDPSKGAAHFPPGLKSSSSATVFTIASLQQYTNSFSEENVIGEGSLGNVYRAQLPQGKLLAVKKLSNAINRTQSDGQFLNLVSDILKLKHGNVLELLGYCNEFDQRLLVYEYSPNGSLQDALHLNTEIHKKLTWNVRMKVALGASRALQFLHEACQPPVVHQNFKSSKVLLDERLAVRIVDCGLAHLLPPRSTNQIGGYAAPEVELGSYTCQSDVYSLGVVMLELLTGRRPFDRTRPRGQQTLAQWAIPRLHDIDELTRMVDPSLHGAYPMKSLSRFADIISRSLQMEPGFRPPISEIVQDLEHLM